MSHKNQLEMTRTIAAKIPPCRARCFPGEDHLMVVFYHPEKVMQVMSNLYF